jgi:hypothetical protein
MASPTVARWLPLQPQFSSFSHPKNPSAHFPPAGSV